LKGLAGLVLAAGASTRMGRPKQLLPIAQSTLLDRVLLEALNSDLGKVVLVLGFKAGEIMAGLQTDPHHPKLMVVENRNPRQGISSSIITGLSAVENEWDAVMIILADMPHITARLINLLMRRAEESRRPLAALVTRGKRSHPVIIRRPFFPALHGLRGDEGAKALFVEHSDQVCLVEPEGSFDDCYIDTQDDYLAVKKKLESS
jgi:molybdenum cofactor cytidylyltransferase